MEEQVTIIKTIDDLKTEKGIVVSFEDDKNICFSPKDYEIVVNEIQIKNGLKTRIDANLYRDINGKGINVKYS